MRGLDQSLPYWMSFSLDRSDAKHDSMFWRHEWDKHGSCTGLDQRTYFMAAYYMSSSLQLLRGLQAEGVVPSNTRRYALADLEAAVAKVTGGPLLPKALLCARDPRTRGALQLTRVTVCVDKTSVLPAPCPPSATGTVVEDAADADDALTSTGVPDDRNTPGLGVLVDCRTAHGGIFFPALVDGSNDSGQLWLWGNKGDWAWLLGLAVLAICMGAAWMMAPRSHAGAARLLAGSVGGWPGCRTACCAPTPTVVHNPLAAVPLVIHEHALDVAAVRAADPALGRALDLLPTGVALSGDAARRAVLAGVLADPRPPNPAGLVADVLVIVSHGDGQALPADDGQALSADEASIAEAAERMYLGDNSAMRCVTPLPASRIGHWLATRPVVQDEVLVLRPPGSDSCIALASADALFDIRDRLARPAVHTIAAWEVDDDGRPVAAQLGVASAVAAALSGEADAYELDEATLAHVRRRRLSKLALFRVLFPSHSNNAAFSRAVDALLADGLLSRRDLRDAGGPNRLWGTLIDAANDEATRRGTRFVLDGVGVGTVDALLAEDGAKKAKLAGPLEFKKEGGAANVQLPAGLVEGLPLFDWRASEGALAERLARRALESLGGVPKPVSVADICEPQSDGAANEPVQQKLDAKTVQSPFFRGTGQASKAGPPPADVDAVTRSARGRRLAAAASATTESGLLTASRRLATSGFSAKASAASCCKPPAPGDALAASFYQRPIHDDDAILDAGDTLVRERPSVVHLISFLLGVAALSKVRLFAAYALLLLSVVVRLLVPLAYAEALSAMVSAYGIGLHTNTVLAVGLTGAAIVLRGAGTLVLADFARHALSTMYGRLFNHILYQDATSFIEHLPPGELMVRASGSSLTLRTLVTTTAFQLVEGVILFFGTIAMMLMSASGLMSRSEPGMRVVVLAVSGLAIAEGIYAGRFMWKQNLAVRRGLGSTFGFSSDTVGAPATVAAMGARPRLEQDFVRFLGDYVAAAYVQGVAKSTHSALAELCSIVMRLSILWLTAKVGGVIGCGGAWVWGGAREVDLISWALPHASRPPPIITVHVQGRRRPGHGVCALRIQLLAGDGPEPNGRRIWHRHGRRWVARALSRTARPRRHPDPQRGRPRPGQVPGTGVYGRRALGRRQSELPQVGGRPGTGRRRPQSRARQGMCAPRAVAIGQKHAAGRAGPAGRAIQGRGPVCICLGRPAAAVARV